MSIFGNSISIFVNRKRGVICTPPYSFFYASWFLLRMRSENVRRSTLLARYHWQQERYEWRDQGRQRKTRKTFPKDHKKTQSLWRQAHRWHLSTMPLY